MSAEKLLLFLVMLSVLVVLHEYGHFLLARRNGVRVDDFALGMGPTLLKWTSKRSGTNYRLNLFPIGGYCAMKGEDGKTSEAEQQRAFQTDGKHDDDNFQAKTPWQRLAIVVAGPIANFIVALVLLFVSAAVFGVAGQRPDHARLPARRRAIPASKAGLHPGDLITAIDGVPMKDGDQLVHTIYAVARARRSRSRTSATARTTTSRSRPRPSRTPTGKPQGRLGFSPMPAMRPAGIPEAAQAAWGQFAGWSSRGTLGVLGQLVTNFVADRRPAPGADRHRPGLGAGRRTSAGSLPLARRDALDLARHLQPAADPGARRRARASSSSSRCCAASRSTRKRKRSCTSAGSPR